VCVVTLDELARAHVDCKHPTQSDALKHKSMSDHGHADGTVQTRVIGGPRKSQPTHVARVNLRQRTEMLSIRISTD
jgi:hypothetical protein